MRHPRSSPAAWHCSVALHNVPLSLNALVRIFDPETLAGTNAEASPPHPMPGHAALLSVSSTCQRWRAALCLRLHLVLLAIM